ncbi:three-helix bundle dimerization domain-containing protein [Geodermatophilus sp. SYSU D00815]
MTLAAETPAASSVDASFVDTSFVDASFVDTMVLRLAAEYGADREELRRRAEAALASFAGARVRAFVPILVEKRLREAYRRTA